MSRSAYIDHGYYGECEQQDLSDELQDWSEDTPTLDLVEAEAGEIDGPVSGAAVSVLLTATLYKVTP